LSGKRFSVASGGFASRARLCQSAALRFAWRQQPPR
jgi:hypothetical protein